jgi:hypothetical protein
LLLTLLSCTYACIVPEMFGFGGKSTPEPAPEPAYSVDLGSESSISHSTSSSNFMESSSSASEDAELQVSKVVSYMIFTY